MLEFVGRKGPFDGEPAFTQILESSGRLANVAIAELRSSGFRKFAWVHPSETLGEGGQTLGAEEYPYGAFVYEMEGEDSVEQMLLT